MTRPTQGGRAGRRVFTRSRRSAPGFVARARVRPAEEFSKSQIGLRTPSYALLVSRGATALVKRPDDGSRGCSTVPTAVADAIELNAVAPIGQRAERPQKASRFMTLCAIAL